MSEIPDFFHALTGWRKFGTTGGDKLLTSAGHTDHVWPVADLGEAYCRMNTGQPVYSVQTDQWQTRTHHDAPQLGCTCGFYCYKERADAEQHSQGTILAKVEIWGRLAEHARGYRAQHMKILELYVAPGFAAIDALTKRYNVAVFIDEGASKWISENPYGSSLPNPSVNLYAGWSSLNTSKLPYLPYNPNTSQSPSVYQSAQALAAQLSASPQQTQAALAQLNSANYQQQWNYAMSNAIHQIGLVPKAPYVMMPTRYDVLYGMGTVGAVLTGGTTGMTIQWEEIDGDDEVTPPPTAESAPESGFDPVAERVEERLRKSAA